MLARCVLGWYRAQGFYQVYGFARLRASRGFLSWDEGLALGGLSEARLRSFLQPQAQVQG